MVCCEGVLLFEKAIEGSGAKRIRRKVMDEIEGRVKADTGDAVKRGKDEALNARRREVRSWM